jgi:hypothetical protein
VTELDTLAEIAEGLLAMNADVVVRFRLLHDILADRYGEPDLRRAYDGLLQSRWVRQLADEQWSDGSWGPLHTQDYAAMQKIPTTEAGVERAVAMGLARDGPILRHATSYLLGLLRGKVPSRDRPEKNDRWETGVQLFAAATLAQIQPNLPALDAVWALWTRIAGRAFASGSYDAGDEVSAHRDLTGASVAGSYLVIDSKYALALLASRASALPPDLEEALVDWVWHKEDGVGYLREPLSRPPCPMKSGPVERWFASQELLSRFPSWRRRAAGVIGWLWEQRADQGWWDFGSRSRLSSVLPMSESWRTKGSREHDWTTRTLILLRRYYAQSTLPLLITEPDPVAARSNGSAKRQPEPQRYVIRRMRLAHCKRGPSRCERCRELDEERLCLLALCPADAGKRQSRVIPVRREGREVWCEFDIVRTFTSQAEAREYAREHGIEDVQL